MPTSRCLHCRGPRFFSTLWPLAAYHSLSLLLISCPIFQLSCHKGTKSPPKNLKNGHQKLPYSRKVRSVGRSVININYVRVLSIKIFLAILNGFMLGKKKMLIKMLHLTHLTTSPLFSLKQTLNLFVYTVWLLNQVETLFLQLRGARWTYGKESEQQLSAWESLRDMSIKHKCRQTYIFLSTDSFSNSQPPQ